MIYSKNSEKVKQLKQKIDSFGTISEDIKKKINYKFRLDWNYYSNSMEGNTLTREETRSVMVGNIDVNGRPIKDLFEMKGHDDVILEILKIGKGEVRISEKRIKDIHKAIMYEEDSALKSSIGNWKSIPNHVINYKNEKFEYTDPSEVSEAIHNLLNITNAKIDELKIKNTKVNPLDIAIQFHLDYVLIHPFYDGNGRTARILTNLLLISFGYPPFWIKTRERDTYNNYISDIQGYGGDSKLFYEFIINLILRSQQLVLDAIDGKEIEELDDLDKELALLKTELGGENILKVKANADVIINCIEISILPLFNLLEKKCLQLNEYFLDFEKRIEYELDGENQIKLFERSYFFELMLSSMLLDTNRPIQRKIKFIQFIYILNGFKKSVSGNLISICVKFNFDNYNFNIENNQGSPSNIYPYGHIFNEKEMSTIISPIIKNVINNMKYFNNKK